MPPPAPRFNASDISKSLNNQITHVCSLPQICVHCGDYIFVAVSLSFHFISMASVYPLRIEKTNIPFALLQATLANSR
jgi:hypothetical protein